jgi:hypothetical protein
MHILRGHQQERPRTGLLGRGSTPPEPNEDGPTIMTVATLAISEDDGAYETPTK